MAGERRTAIVRVLRREPGTFHSGGDPAAAELDGQCKRSDQHGAVLRFGEDIALGVRDANYEKFDIGKVLERLLLKGSMVVKKAYCDWDR